MQPPPDRSPFYKALKHGADEVARRLPSDALKRLLDELARPAGDDPAREASYRTCVGLVAKAEGGLFLVDLLVEAAAAGSLRLSNMGPDKPNDAEEADKRLRRENEARRLANEEIAKKAAPHPAP